MDLNGVAKPTLDRLEIMADEFDRRGFEIVTLRNALAEAEAERIALADALRAALERSEGKVQAALITQAIIDNAKPKDM